MPVTINGTTGIAGPDGSASTPAVQGTDSNTGLFYPAADTVALSTGGTERMRIDSSGNVLVGKTSLSDSTAGIQLRTQGVYVVGCTSSGSEALMLNRNTSDGTIASIKRGNTEVGTISVTSSATAYNTASPSTDGAQLNYQGITFRATQSASSDANTLDDYEEGTWTPTIIGSITAGTVNYGASRVGRYTKIGRLVQFECYVTWSSGTGSGNLQVSGLPFTPAGGTYAPVACTLESVTLTANNYACPYVYDGVSYVVMAQNPTGGGSRTVIGYDVVGEIQLMGTYSI